MVPQGLALFAAQEVANLSVAGILGSGWGRRKRSSPLEPKANPYSPHHPLTAFV